MQARTPPPPPPPHTHSTHARTRAHKHTQTHARQTQMCADDSIHCFTSPEYKEWSRSIYIMHVVNCTVRFTLIRSKVGRIWTVLASSIPMFSSFFQSRARTDTQVRTHWRTESVTDILSNTRDIVTYTRNAHARARTHTHTHSWVG